MVAPEISAELSKPFEDQFGYATHEVTNQPPSLTDYDAFGTDEVLKTIVRTFGAEKYRSRLDEAGITVGSGRVQELARLANRNLPELRTHDRFGQRVDRVDFHPAWHELMELAMAQDTRTAGTSQDQVHRSRARLSLIFGIRARMASVVPSA
jgi:putative acyl-CoA dehydrogenase